MPTFLTPHFSLEELSITEQRGLDNRPSPAMAERLRRTAEQMEKVRALLGDRPITVTSGIRMFLSRCTPITRRRGRPLARANLM